MRLATNLLTLTFLGFGWTTSAAMAQGSAGTPAPVCSGCDASVSGDDRGGADLAVCDTVSTTSHQGTFVVSLTLDSEQTDCHLAASSNCTGASCFGTFSLAVQLLDTGTTGSLSPDLYNTIAAEFSWTTDLSPAGGPSGGQSGGFDRVDGEDFRPTGPGGTVTPKIDGGSGGFVIECGSSGSIDWELDVTLSATIGQAGCTNGGQFSGTLSISCTSCS